MARKSTREHKWALACTVAVAAAVGAPAPASETTAVENLQRYCQTSWRNAGIAQQEWPDCTQQAVAELIERISSPRLEKAIGDHSSPERRELNRTVWRIIKRWQRSPRLPSIQVEPASTASQSNSWPEVARTARSCLTARQWQILNMTRDGWHNPEIADQLGISAAQVSDEKYKAIRKLRSVLC